MEHGLTSSAKISSYFIFLHNWRGQGPYRNLLIKRNKEYKEQRTVQRRFKKRKKKQRR
jgi:hypothetical protein